jgi:hypothetical protein
MSHRHTLFQHATLLLKHVSKKRETLKSYHTSTLECKLFMSVYICKYIPKPHDPTIHQWEWALPNAYERAKNRQQKPAYHTTASPRQTL